MLTGPLHNPVFCVPELEVQAKQMKDHAPSVIKNMVLPWCQDTNTKVSLTALALLLKIIPLYHAAFTSILTSEIVKKLAKGMSATNAKIIEVTSLALDNMIVCGSLDIIGSSLTHPSLTHP